MDISPLSKKILDSLIEGAFLFDKAKNIIYLNKNAVRITGYNLAELQKLEDFYELIKDPAVKEDICCHLGQEDYYGIVSIRDKFASEKFVEIKFCFLENRLYLITMVDITFRIKKEAELKNIENKFRLAVKGAKIGVWEWEEQKGYSLLNPEDMNFFHFRAGFQKLDEKLLLKNIYFDDRKRVAAEIDKIVNQNKDYLEVEYRVKSKNGDWKWIRNLARVYERGEDNKALKIIGIYLDIDEQKKIERKITELSLKDELTGLYNRRFFNEEIARLKNSRDYPITILVGDIDDLKQINDSCGHNAGDDYIKLTAKILKNNLRAADIVARIGGDEFAVILPKTNWAIAEEICERIKNEYKQINHCSDSEKEFSISLGIATINSSAEDIEDCFNRADKRMYKNKLQKKFNKRFDI